MGNINQMNKREKKIDTNKDRSLEKQEVAKFVNSEKNLKELANALKKNPQQKELEDFLQNNLENIVDAICNIPNLTEKQLGILKYYKEKYIHKSPEKAQKINEILIKREKEKQEEEKKKQEEEKKNLEKIFQKEFKNPIKNLDSLGINTNKAPNRDIIKETIKEPEDVEKIT